MQKVVVLGASPKPERYANKAIKLLKKYGHRVFPVSLAYEEIEGLKNYKTLAEVPEQPVETLTLYLGSKQIEPLIPQIVAFKPGRVILNPGTEDDRLMVALEAAEIPYLQACTLVLLQTNQFE